MLRDLLQYAYEVTGIPLDKRDQLLRLVNRAARELYDCADLPGSYGEKVFTFDADSGTEKLITLPWFIGSIRAARLYEIGPRIDLVSVAEKYAPRSWQPPFLEWRVYHRSPLVRTLTQATQLTFTISTAETTPIEITVVGQTTTAARVNETVIIDVGATSVTTLNQWSQDDPDGIVSLQKNRVTNTDVVVTTTVDGTEVSKIPNRAFEARNIVIQISDDLSSYSTIDNSVEILYKKVWIPFYYDTDVFCAPELEDAIVWKLREHWYSVKAADAQNELMAAAAMAAKAKCDALMQATIATIESERKRRVVAAPSALTGAAINYAKLY